jgi:hypothetical protein
MQRGIPLKSFEIKRELMKYILNTLILCFVSCNNKHGVEFIIHNESAVTIDSVRISTSDNRSTIKLFDIQQGMTKTDFLDMNDIAKTDGDYLIKINTIGATKTNRMGYYTNGAALDEKIDVYFSNDTIIYKQKAVIIRTNFIYFLLFKLWT